MKFPVWFIVVFMGASFACAESTTADARVYFISPHAGQMVRNPVTVRFGLRGMGVAPAGTHIPHTGHHHLILDAPLPALERVVPKDERHLHFGNGQTETVLNLKPGWHTLQLLFADSGHVPHKPPVVSQKIGIFVVPDTMSPPSPAP
ncbi:MAG: DUF4399 domain-containing protein [Magnetococcus sp. MYC-9]